MQTAPQSPLRVAVSPSIDRVMPFAYSRTIRLADTDAAGVVYFARTLSLCHEAYEAALAAAGVPLRELLGTADIIVPISRSNAEYLRPLQAGDVVRINVTPERRDDSTFVLAYEVVRLGKPDKLAARVTTEHVCSSLSKRARVAIPDKLVAWITAG